ncbi:MAG TPA: hypothetical protein VL574_06365 [Stellaceae bacterium]|nr:hypothetical protein [Stellaceae bacterium]
MRTIDDEIAAYDALRPRLEQEHLGKWVLFFDRNLVDVFDQFDHAAETALDRFGGEGPYLIRRVGAPPFKLPTSVMFHPASPPAGHA